MSKAGVIVFRIVITLLVSIYAFYNLYSYIERYRDLYESRHLFDLVSPDNNYSISVSNIWVNMAGSNYGRFDEVSLLDNTDRRIAVFYLSTKSTSFNEDSFEIDWLDDSVAVHVVGTDYIWRVGYRAVAGRSINNPLAPKIFLIIACFLTVVFISSFICLLFVDRFRMMNILIIAMTIALWGGCKYLSERTSNSIDCVIQQSIDQEMGDVTLTNGNMRLLERYFDKISVHWSTPNSSDNSIGVGVRGQIDDSRIEVKSENDCMIIHIEGEDSFTFELIPV